VHVLCDILSIAGRVPVHLPLASREYGIESLMIEVTKVNRVTPLLQ
jgi:hypothetical protein